MPLAEAARVSSGRPNRAALHLCGNEFRPVLAHSIGLAISCLIAYSVITHLLVDMFSVSVSDELLGGMWAVVATAFVYRTSYQQSMAARAFADLGNVHQLHPLPALSAGISVLCLGIGDIDWHGLPDLDVDRPD